MAIQAAGQKPPSTMGVYENILAVSNQDQMETICPPHPGAGHNQLLSAPHFETGRVLQKTRFSPPTPMTVKQLSNVRREGFLFRCSLG